MGCHHRADHSCQVEKRERVVDASLSRVYIVFLFSSTRICRVCCKSLLSTRAPLPSPYRPQCRLENSLDPRVCPQPPASAPNLVAVDQTGRQCTAGATNAPVYRLRSGSAVEPSPVRRPRRLQDGARLGGRGKDRHADGHISSCVRYDRQSAFISQGTTLQCIRASDRKERIPATTGLPRYHGAGSIIRYSSKTPSPAGR